MGATETGTADLVQPNVLQETKKVQDVIARARAVVEQDLTSAQTDRELADTRDELARLDKLSELAKIEDVVARAHLHQYPETDAADRDAEESLETQLPWRKILQEKWPENCKRNWVVWKMKNRNWKMS
eukprot:Gregarina_sp_Poly_1__718@NODE_1170_length_4869_cov_152_708663_g801_i0_p4_GENE_NODE_1170_length_4869_cov_152_708663_g801_i0NODE_1170_length_4869_cov_152_708663_g801_i0_p4_ORF_typecomplete_len128_score20_15MauJ/PF17419_2/0_039_NODE_1170_length_4869_cov_152_708663_g801_i020072390